MSSAMDGQDGNGLQLGKKTFGERFHLQHLHLLKLPKNVLIYLLLGVPGAL